ncbi:hypothetical protein BDR26DRAFT_905194 [Obelidium mucronatum]|nr:hypothetical protein BDR26DRAFT_905194 [Obelidium mucronatum]
MSSNLVFFVKHGSNPPVKIETHFDRLGAPRPRPLTDVADATDALAPLFAASPSDHLSLHLPAAVLRASSGLGAACFLSEESESDSTLDPGCALAALLALNVSSKRPLRVVVNSIYSLPLLSAESTLSLHLPAAVLRASSGLGAACFLSEESESDSTLDPGCALAALLALNVSSKRPLRVVVNSIYSLPLLSAESTASGPRVAMSNVAELKPFAMFPKAQKYIQNNGIVLSSPHLPRKALVESIIDRVLENRFVLMSSSAGSGKTSLLQLFQDFYPNCIYLSVRQHPPGSEPTCLDLIKSAGIDITHKIYPQSSSDRPLVVMIDDAQLTFSGPVNRDAWATLLKLIPICVPETIKFLIATTHSLRGGYDSPAEFQDLPKFDRNSLLLSSAEANEFLDLDTGLSDELKEFNLLKSVIISQCGGSIGALRVSASALNDFVASVKDNTTVTETEAVSYYFSLSVLTKMARVFGSDHSRITAPLNEFLVSCFTNGKALVPSDLNKADTTDFLKLQKTGILVDSNGLVCFSSIIAKRYFLNWLFPRRALNNPATLIDLVRLCIEFMSCSMLSKSVVNGFPKEATFQHLFMEALAKFTAPDCAICPELSKIYPGADQEGGTIKGEIDFYLNGSLRWGIELLVSGRTITKHMDRFAANGKYYPLAVNDYVVIDFRQSRGWKPNQYSAV